MNKNKLIGLAFVAVSVALVGVISTSVGDAAARFVGKAVWYLPYAALIGGIRFLTMVRS